jgi:flagellar biosynthesis protein FlhG
MKSPVIVATGSGKGGIGKTTFIANVGATLTTRGYSVGFIDADLGGANLHTHVGLKRPKVTLADFLAGRRKTLDEVRIETPIENSWLISGASDIVELANPRYSKKRKLLRHLHQLEADYLLIDLGAGSSSNTTDFFAAFPYGVVVTDSLPTSIENAYGFLKNSLVRGVLQLFPGRKDMREAVARFTDPAAPAGVATMTGLLRSIQQSMPEEAQTIKQWLAQRKTFLVLNMLKDSNDVQTGMRFAEVVKKYLGLKLYYIGYIVQEPAFRTSIRSMKPLVTEKNGDRIRQCFAAIADNLITLTQGSANA